MKVTKKLEIVFSASIVRLHILQWNGEKQELIIPFVKKLWFILTVAQQSQQQWKKLDPSTATEYLFFFTLPSATIFCTWNKIPF